MIRSKPFIIIAITLLLGGGVIYFLSARTRLGAAVELHNYEAFPTLTPQDRVAIVSPHLDDETLGVGGLIAQLRERQVSVSVIFMTNGDDNPIGTNLEFRTGYPSPEQLLASGETRQQEALSALAKLGVERERIYFLGLPDRGLRAIYQNPSTEPYRAPGTLQTASPYKNSYIPDLSYTAEATQNALIRSLSEINPTVILTTPVRDKHSDHSATARFVQTVEPQLAGDPKIYYFLVHYSRYPRPGGRDSTFNLLPPLKLSQEEWKVIYLEPGQIQKKEEAVEEYKTQLQVPLLGKLMRSFVRQNELVFP